MFGRLFHKKSITTFVSKKLSIEKSVIVYTPQVNIFGRIIDIQYNTLNNSLVYNKHKSFQFMI